MSDIQYRLLNGLIEPPISGGRPSGGVSSDTEGVPSIGGENIVLAGGMDYSELKRVPETFYQQMPKGKLRINDVLINKDGAQTGKVGIYDGRFDQAAVNEHVFILRAADPNQLDQTYLYYCVLLPETRQKIERRINGSAQPGLNSQFVRAVTVPYWDAGHQIKISSILETIDQTIEKTEALIEKYQQIKAGLMHDLFTRGIGTDGKLRPPREQAPELYQETPIGWIPKMWGWVSIESCKENLVDGPFGSNLKTEHYVSDPGIRVVRLQNIQAMKYNDQDKAFVSDKHANSLFRNKVGGNDVLIAGLGEDRYPVGRACVYPNDLPPAINKADCFRLRCKDGLMNNTFIMYFLNTSAARFQVRKYEQGVTRPRINLGNMNKLITPLPEIDEQKAICFKLTSLESRIDAEMRKKRKLLKQKSGLMHDLLTGKVPVKVDPPEAAHV